MVNPEEKKENERISSILTLDEKTKYQDGWPYKKLQGYSSWWTKNAEI